MSRLGLFAGLLGMLVLVAGCGSSDDAGEQADSIALPELSLEAALDDVTDDPQEAASSAPREEKSEVVLQLSLSPGMRVPLKKTVSQRLIQGNSVSHSRLELWMSVEVEQVEKQRNKLRVEYFAVTYTHDIGGQTVLYDSRIPNSIVPPEARLYEGLVNNGFGFWLNDRNQITDLDGFDLFLYRCVQSIPEAERQAALSQLAAQVGEAEIANFVDDSIGLLPYGPTVIGAEWTRSRRALQPLPMELETRCTLADLNPEVAEIDLVGIVSPASNRGIGSVAGAQPGEVRVNVTSGQSYGRCRIRRATGLPIESEIKLMLDLLVEIPGSLPMEQKKEIVTRIELFQPAGQAVNLSAPRGRTPAPSAATATY